MRRGEVINCKCGGAGGVSRVGGVKSRRVSELASIPGLQRRGTEGASGLTIYGMRLGRPPIKRRGFNPSGWLIGIPAPRVQFFRQPLVRCGRGDRGKHKPHQSVSIRRRNRVPHIRPPRRIFVLVAKVGLQFRQLGPFTLAEVNGVLQERYLKVIEADSFILAPVWCKVVHGSKGNSQSPKRTITQGVCHLSSRCLLIS